MRPTIHNSRAGKDGVYSPKHNDRNFDSQTAEHIDQEKSQGNWYWNCLERSDLTFEEVEAEFYKIHCTKHLNAQNQRYQAQRHKERIKDIDAYRTAKQTCPEETILMLGNKDEYLPPKTLKSICEEFKNWEEKTFPGLHVLDMALHIDEQGAPHIHERKVWLYIDKDGFEAVGQDKALQQAGIKPPHPEQARSRYNNRKQTYSKQARQKFIDICRDRGFGSLLETQPREKSKSGQQLTQYKADKAEEQAKQLFILINKQQQKVDDLRKEENILNLRLKVKQNDYKEIQENIEDIQEKLNRSKNFLHLAEQRQAFEEYQYDKQHERIR